MRCTDSRTIARMFSRISVTMKRLKARLSPLADFVEFKN
jgi:hypothetical protein